MAAKDKKNQKFYEVTKERKASPWEIVLSVGAIGATLGFFTSLLAGACSQSATLDSIMVVALLATVLGFGLGILVAWVFRKYFGNLLDQVTKVPAPVAGATASPAAEAPAATGPENAAAPEEGKGKSVDYVFPEFSPDQR